VTTPTLGERVADLRRLRGFSQRELASEMKRSESWVSQVERDVQPIEGLSVLRALARALGVSVRDLRPDALTESGDESPVPNDLDSLRLELSGHPALGVLFATAEAAEPVDFDELHEAVDNVWTLAHESQYAALSDALTELLPRLEHAVREDQGDERKRVHALRARAYQAAAAAFARGGVRSSV
jgi:transcriptional regulator with XRE-family HTH domain